MRIVESDLNVFKAIIYVLTITTFLLIKKSCDSQLKKEYTHQSITLVVAVCDLLIVLFGGLICIRRPFNVCRGATASVASFNAN